MIAVNQWLVAQTFTLNIVNADVDCSEAIVCYDVTIATDSEFGLGSYNLRFLYDCSSIDYIVGSININNLPTPYSITNALAQCGDATGLGSLPYESNLGFLQIAIDYVPSTPEDVTSAGTTILQNLCFQIGNSAILTDPTECFDLVWLTEETREDYFNGSTTINQDSGGQ